MYFISRNDDTHYEPGDSSLKPSPESMTSLKKRCISPSPAERDDENHVHNCEDHQNKRKKLLIKRALLKSFVSSVNTKIDMKRPSLPITIPTYLLFDQCFNGETSKSSQEAAIDRSQRTSKRNVNGSFKQETPMTTTTTDVPDNSFSQLHNGQQKKNKNSHVHEKTSSKPIDSSSNSNTVKTEVNVPMATTVASTSNETDHQTRSATTSQPEPTTTSSSTLTVQPKKEKPTAKYDDERFSSFSFLCFSLSAWGLCNNQHRWKIFRQTTDQIHRIIYFRARRVRCFHRRNQNTRNWSTSIVFPSFPFPSDRFV